MSGEKALDGVRIVEFCDSTGSYCGRLLADLGAEVIKVEPPGGDIQRLTGPFYRNIATPDTSVAFWVHNTSKKSVVLDLETDAGRSAAKALALTADIVLEDRPVGYLAARGLGYEALAAERPQLVYTSVTGFGQTGPHAAWAYIDIVGQAMGGLMTLAGEAFDPPNSIYGNQADISASVHAAQGTMMALLHAEATGVGQQVDVSVQEAVSMSQETAMMTWDFQKRNRTRTGALGMIPIQLPGAGIYRAKDGWVSLFVIAPGGADFPALIEWMREAGMAGDLDEEPYASICAELNMRMLTLITGDPASAAELLPHLAHINEAVAAFIATMTAREAYEQGQGRRMLFGIVSTPKDLTENTQLRARDWYRPMEFDYLDVTIEFPGPPYRLGETPTVITRPPRLGEHTEEILGALVMDTQTERFYDLPRAAKDACGRGEFELAESLARELLSLAVGREDDWSYGNAIHDGHAVLGRVALSRGDRANARAELLQAGGSPGSPQLGSFGPNAMLAAEMLKAGETDAVLEYFELVRAFWRMGGDKLDEWRRDAVAGREPAFGANRRY